MKFTSSKHNREDILAYDLANEIKQELMVHLNNITGNIIARLMETVPEGEKVSHLKLEAQVEINMENFDRMLSADISDHLERYLMRNQNSDGTVSK